MARIEDDLLVPKELPPKERKLTSLSTVVYTAPTLTGDPRPTVRSIELPGVKESNGSRVTVEVIFGPIQRSNNIQRLTEGVQVSQTILHENGAQSVLWKTERNNVLPASQLFLQTREVDIIVLVAQGLSIPQIAGILNISSKTTRNYWHAAMDVFGTHTKTELLLKAVSSGIISVTLGEQQKENFASFTPTERHVMAALVTENGEESTNAHIAAKLGVTVKTAKNYLSQIFRKTNTTLRSAVAIQYNELKKMGLEKKEPKNRQPHLTEYQKDLLSLIAQGYSNAEIAEMLGATESVIKGKRERLFRKFSIKPSAQVNPAVKAVVMATEQGDITLQLNEEVIQRINALPAFYQQIIRIMVGNSGIHSTHLAIAEQLHYSEGFIKDCASKILTLTGLTHKVALAAYYTQAQRQGLLKS